MMESAREPNLMNYSKMVDDDKIQDLVSVLPFKDAEEVVAKTN